MNYQKPQDIGNQGLFDDFLTQEHKSCKLTETVISSNKKRMSKYSLSVARYSQRI